MAFKINISEKLGKTFHLETECEELMGKELHNKINGKDISDDLVGYEFELTGASDKAGFTTMENVEGIGLKKVLLTYGKGMKNKPRREGKRKRSKNKPKGLRLRKTVRGKIISPAIVQINLKVLKEGDKKLSEIFPDQCKKAVQETESPTSPKQSNDSSTKPEQKQEAPKQESIEKKPEDAEIKEEGAKEKESKEEKELTQPEKEPTSEKPIEEKTSK